MPILSFVGSKNPTRVNCSWLLEKAKVDLGHNFKRDNQLFFIFGYVIEWLILRRKHAYTIFWKCEGFFPQKDDLRALFLTFGFRLFDVTKSDVKNLLTLEWLHLGWIQGEYNRIWLVFMRNSDFILAITFNCGNFKFWCKSDFFSEWATL